ncbi:MAG TPA: amino acid adenylation domain-containing protein, partial [Longimicrobiaceae bacterium]
LALLMERLREKESGRAPAPSIPRRPGTGPAPLSFAQERLWFIDQMEPGNPAYNELGVTRLEGVLDVEALARALAAVVERHDALRTVFAARGGEPEQVVVDGMRVPLETEDLSALPPEEAEAAAERRVREEPARPFDLARGPLLRATLLRLAPERHLLLLAMHHVVSDGWSRGIIVREVSEAYAAFAGGAEPRLPEPPVRYADYAAWQRERLRGELLERQLGYWTAKLAGAPPSLELPTDRPRPPVQSFAGGTHRFRVPAAVADALRALAREEEATLFMVLLAAWKTLLARYAGETDLVVGTPVANRGRAETEGLVGFLANTLALRTDLGGDPAFREALRRVRGTALGAYEHEELPFGVLVAELHPERDLSRPPLCQVMFLLDSAPPAPLELPGVRLVPVEADTGISAFDLTLRLAERDGALDGALEYASALWDAPTVAGMAAAFRALLEDVAASPDRRVSELSILPAGERGRLLGEWSPGERGEPGEPRLHARFEAQARRTPVAVAVEHAGESLTYAELDARAELLAAGLRARGVVPEAVVGICLEPGTELVTAVLAVLKAGAAYLPLDPAYPAERLAYMLEDAAAPLLLTAVELRERLPEFRGEIVLVEQGVAPAEGGGESSVVPDSLAYVIYTSGSTGLPKGVAVPHRGPANLLDDMEMRAPLRPGDRCAVWTRLGFDVSVYELFSALSAGGTLLFPAEETRASAEGYAAWLEAERVASAYVPPFMLRDLANRAEARPGAFSLRRLLVGVEPIPEPLLRRVADAVPGVRVVNGYGPTEASICATLYSLPEGPAPERTAPIGRPVRNTRVHLLDGGLNPVPGGVPGELYAGGAGLARGYLARPGLTAERFVPDPFAAEPGARLYRTGDRARWLPDGTLQFLGRADRQAKVRGFRVEPGEVEAVLRAHPAVHDALAEVRDGADGGKVLVGYLIVETGSGAPSAGELRGFLRERLPEYMVPSAFVALEAFPLTPSGKVDRRALPAPDSAPGEAAALAPRTPTQEVLAGIWAEVLGVERVGAGDDFFALGGHSLLATRVVSRVREGLGADVPVRALFEAPTVAELAARVDAARGGGPTPPIARVPRDGPLPLSFAQQRLWFLHQLEPAGYNLGTGFRLHGELSAEALRKALEGVVARHEALRTRFVERGGEVAQVVEPARPFVLPLVDLGPFDPAGREEHVARYAADEVSRPFDLREAPLMRATLLRLSEREHVLLVAVHHVVSDGWSVGILVRELRAHYEAALAGTEADLPPLALQYADYAVWQRGRLEGDALARRLDFWRARLQGAPAALDLPSDRPRPPVQSFAGDTFTFRLEPGPAEALRALARREDATLFMVLLAGFAAWLHRYTGQDDLVVGTPVAGRDHPALEPLIGCFINVLPVRARVDGEGSFRDLLRGVRSAALDAYPHGDLSFDQIVEAAGIPRETSRNPLVQVLFALQNTPAGSFSLPGIEAEPVEAAVRTSRYDLSLYLSEEPDGALSTLVEYATDLYDRSTVERWTAHFRRLLEAYAADPGAAVREAPMLDPAEEALLLHGWNRTALELDPDATVPALFEAQARRTPDAVALSADGGTLTYAELDRRAGALAGLLRERGVGPESRVGLLLERSAEMVVAMLGVLKAGGAYLPLDPAYPAERLEYMLADSGARLLLTEVGLAERVPGFGGEVVRMEDAPSDGGVAPAPAIFPHNAAYVIYTSGSTGRPKGVVVTHANAASFFAAMRERVGEAPGSWLAVTSISFDISVLEILWTLTQGSRVVLHGVRPRAAVAAGRRTRPTDFSLFYFASSAEGSGRGKYRL